MRRTTFVLLTLLSVSALATGCAGDSAPDVTAASDEPDAIETPSEPAIECPDLAEGVTVEAALLEQCLVQGMTDTAGFAVDTAVNTSPGTTRYDSASGSLEELAELESIVVIGDQGWVKTWETPWMEADESSDIVDISEVSIIANAYIDGDQTEDIKTTVAVGAPGDMFTVTSTSERLGQQVFVLTGTANLITGPLEATHEVTGDYIMLASTAVGELGGIDVTSTWIMAEWDAAQEIVAPR